MYRNLFVLLQVCLFFVAFVDVFVLNVLPLSLQTKVSHDNIAYADLNLRLCSLGPISCLPKHPSHYHAKVSRHSFTQFILHGAPTLESRKQQQTR